MPAGLQVRRVPAAAESERRPVSETRQYELVYVVSPEVTDEGVTELHERVVEIVGQLGGSIDKTDNWGRRRLAYEIDRHREGTYVIELITGPGALVTELERRLRVMEQLLRYLVVRVDEDLRKAQRARERRQSRQQRRLAKRGAVGSAPAAAPGSVAAAPESVAATGVAAASGSVPAAASEPVPAGGPDAPTAGEPATAAAASEPAASEPAAAPEPAVAAAPEPARTAGADEVAGTGEPASAAAASDSAPALGPDQAAETAEKTDE